MTAAWVAIGAALLVLFIWPGLLIGFRDWVHRTIR